MNVLRSIRLIPKNDSELARLSGEPGEIFLDKNDNSLRIFNGKKSGGFALLRADLSNLESSGTSNEVNFGAKTLIASGFQGTLTGNVTGNVTGQVSDLSNLSINSLGDVDTTTAVTGQVMYFDGTNWKGTTLSSSFNGGTIANPLIINNATDSSGTNQGSLTTTGGVGIAKNLYVGGTASVVSGFSITNGNLSITGDITTVNNVTIATSASVKSQGDIKFYDANNTNYIGISAPTNVTTDISFTLPGTLGTVGQVLTTNGAGVMSWSTVSGGGGGGSSNPPGGIATSIQFNDNNSFGGSATLTFDSAQDLLTVPDLTATGTISGSISSSSVTITGGAVDNTPIGDTTRSTGKFTTVAANDTATFTKGTNSTSSTTGTVVVTGGVGVSQDVVVGGAVAVNTTITATGNIVANSNVLIDAAPSAINHASNKQYVDTRSLAMAIAMS